MEAKGKVVPGLSSRRGHRAYVNSLSEKAKREVVLDKVEEMRLLQGLKDPDCEKTPNQTKSRWLHPDTREALKIRWSQRGTNKEKEKI